MVHKLVECRESDNRVVLKKLDSLNSQLQFGKLAFGRMALQVHVMMARIRSLEQAADESRSQIASISEQLKSSIAENTKSTVLIKKGINVLTSVIAWSLFQSVGLRLLCAMFSPVLARMTRIMLPNALSKRLPRSLRSTDITAIRVMTSISIALAIRHRLLLTLGIEDNDAFATTHAIAQLSNALSIGVRCAIRFIVQTLCQWMI